MSTPNRFEHMTRPPRFRDWARHCAAVLLMGVALVFAACGGTTKTGPGANPTPTSGATPQPTATPINHQVLVYFNRHPDSDGYPLKVLPVQRTSPTDDVVTYAVQQYLAGPTEQEKQQGYYNELNMSGPSNSGDRDFTLTYDMRGPTPEKGTVTLQFNRQTTLPGDMSGPRVKLAITTTLTQFPSIKNVVILNAAGYCFADLKSGNECLTGLAEKVYFSKHPDSDNRPALVYPVNRSSPDLQVATFAIQQLIAGPTQAEKQQGYFTPLEGAFSGTSIFGSSDFKITLNFNGTKPDAGTATLQFGRDMKGLGDTGAALATNEIVTTLTQFPTIQRVVILNKDGSHFDNMLG